jgi:hypothetical protein
VVLRVFVILRKHQVVLEEETHLDLLLELMVAVAVVLIVRLGQMVVLALSALSGALVALIRQQIQEMCNGTLYSYC